MITVHGRTRCQFYTGQADWDAIAAVKSVVSVPLVVNGDIANLQDAEAALAKSGADAVMMGRAHYGQPWVAGALALSLEGTAACSIPDNMFDYVVSHYEDMLSAYGSQVGIRHARKHLGWYLDRHARGADHSLRASIMTGNEPTQIIAALKRAFAGSEVIAANERLVA
jgi:tRNA-dihydrouridine synthase